MARRNRALPRVPANDSPFNPPFLPVPLLMSTITQTKTRFGVGDVVVHENYGPADAKAGGRGKGFPPIFKANPKAKQFTWEEVAQHNTGQNRAQQPQQRQLSTSAASERTPLGGH